MTTEKVQQTETPRKEPDKRRNLRAPLIVLKIDEDSERDHLFGYAKNISKSGLFIQSVNPRSPGEQFQIRFEIPGKGLKVFCRCEVVWNRVFKKKGKYEAGYGVRFLDIKKEGSEALDAWVKKNT